MACGGDSDAGATDGRGQERGWKGGREGGKAAGTLKQRRRGVERTRAEAESVKLSEDASE